MQKKMTGSGTPWRWMLGLWLVLGFGAWGLGGCPGTTPPPTETSKDGSTTTDTRPTDTSTEPSEREPAPEPSPREEPSTADTRPDAPPPERATPDGPRPYGLTRRVPNTTCKLPGEPASLASMKIRVAFPHLTFTRPVFVTAAPDGSNRLFVVEQDGTIRVFNNDPNARTASVFLDISSLVSRAHSEMGLLGLAFHPNYKTNRTFFVYYSTKFNFVHHSVVASYKVSANDPNKADPSSAKEILRLKQPFGNHNGGMIAFGPDGYLYVSFGDGGGAGDPKDAGQNLQDWLAKILRIDVDRPANGKAYGIPADNPFVNNANALDEIWAYGLRNVWRFSFDRVAGTLWAGDVGQNAIEEIDIITKGGNYGWNRMEGTQCYNPSTNCRTPSMILPIVEHGRQDAKSITGGYVYRGARLSQLAGAYVYGDFVTGKIWAVRYDGKKVTEHKLLVNSFKNISSFGEDRDGELYFTTFETQAGEGKLYTLDPAATPPPSPFPRKLSQTGCFASVPKLTPAAGLIPYGVNVPLWSDGLDKKRWIALPGTQTITYKADDGWDFPNNTVLVKHFSYQQTKGDENSRRHVETRFLVKQSGDWRGYSYLWNQDQTDAVLLEGNAEVPVSQKDPNAPNNAVSFVHTIPNRNECLQCHTQATNRVLGLSTLQINGDFNYNGVLDNQIRAMHNIKLFGQTLPNNTASLPRLPAIDDTSVPAAQRARAYLHANCANCHRPGVAGVASTDLRFTTPLAQTQTCNVTPEKGDLGVTGAKILVPGKPDASTLFLRTAKRGKDQMPQIGTARVHTDAVALLRQWILGLSSCP